MAPGTNPRAGIHYAETDDDGTAAFYGLEDAEYFIEIECTVIPIEKDSPFIIHAADGSTRIIVTTPWVAGFMVKGDTIVATSNKLSSSDAVLSTRARMACLELQDQLEDEWPDSCVRVIAPQLSRLPKLRVEILTLQSGVLKWEGDFQPLPLFSAPTEVTAEPLALPGKLSLTFRDGPSPHHPEGALIPFDDFVITEEKGRSSDGFTISCNSLRSMSSFPIGKYTVRPWSSAAERAFTPTDFIVRGGETSNVTIDMTSCYVRCEFQLLSSTPEPYWGGTIQLLGGDKPIFLALQGNPPHAWLENGRTYSYSAHTAGFNVATGAFTVDSPLLGSHQQSIRIERTPK